MGGMARTKKKTYKKPFAAALDHYIRVLALTNKDLGFAVGYKDGQMIQAIRSERSNGEETKRRKIAEFFGFTLDEFIKEGSRLIEKQSQAAITATLPSVSAHAEASNVVPIDQKHAEIIRKFKNKDLAVAVNQELLELEALDPDEMKGVFQYIETRKKIVRDKKEAKKREAGSDKTE